MEARNTLRNRLVVWFTAVSTYLSVLTFHIIIMDYSERLLYVLFLPTVVEDVVMSRPCLVLLLAVLMKTCPNV